MTFDNLLNKSLNVKLDVMTSLVYVDVIIHIQIALSFDGDEQFVIYLVHKHIRGLGVGGGYRKIINLPHEEYLITIEDAGI